MAYMNATKKAKLAPAIRSVYKKYGIKGTIAVRNHSTLVANVRSGDIDFAANCKSDNPKLSVNEYYLDRDWSGAALDFLKDLKAAMSTGNHDNSDIMTDYFDVGWYIDINLGRWDKPYVFTGNKEAA